MHIPFEQLPPTARVWIYQANRALSANETVIIENLLHDFSNNWDSHGEGLKNSYAILHERFIALGVDESVKGASGCSIDKSVNIIKTIEQRLNINLMDKTQIAYIDNHGGNISSFDFKQAKQLIEGNKINESTIIFDNLVDNIYDFQHHWKKNISNTWLGKYFK